MYVLKILSCVCVLCCVSRYRFIVFGLNSSTTWLSVLITVNSLEPLRLDIYDIRVCVYYVAIDAIYRHLDSWLCSSHSYVNTLTANI